MCACVVSITANACLHNTVQHNTTEHSLILTYRTHAHIFSCTHIYIPSKYSGVNRCRVTSAYVLRTVVLSTHSRTSTFTLCDVLTSLRYTLRWENNVWKCCCCCSRIKLNVNYMQMMHNKVFFTNFGALCCRLSYSPPPPPPACCSVPLYFLYISFLFLRSIFLHLHLNVTFSEAVSC